MPVATVPGDTYDTRLLMHTHPAHWVNPQPAPKYNLVVIGGGTAGLVTAAGAAGLGAKVALIERELLGGDCLNVGCVPSKALLRSARVAAQLRRAGEFGVRVPQGWFVDFPALMERMRRLRADLSSHDSATRLTSLGVDVFFGSAKFTGSDSVEVGSTKLRFRRAVIATGARAHCPPIPGLAEAGYLTNETVFALRDLPRRFVVIGAGPIGCELAQAFARFGSQVTLLGKHRQVLPKEDQDAVNFVEKTLRRDGITLMLECKVLRVEVRGAEKVLHVSCGGVPHELTTDEILLAVGRQPNVDGLNLEEIGVAFSCDSGVQVDDQLRTTNSRVYAAGDVCSNYKFTHMADAMARIVIQNALFKGRAKASALTVPWCTYTDPEVAHVGLSEHEAKEQGIAYRVFTHEFNRLDRAILDGEVEGFVKVLIPPTKDKILGATIVGTHAGDLISQITLAITGKLGLRRIANTIFPYPTHGEAIKKVGDSYNRTRLNTSVKWLLAKWLAWSRW